jgi:hypothetical protein
MIRWLEERGDEGVRGMADGCYRILVAFEAR